MWSDVWLEVGFGAGEHLAAQARAHPGIAMVGCEPYVTGVASLLSIIDARAWPTSASSTTTRAFYWTPFRGLHRPRLRLFPDPWPKRRHHKRRFIAPHTLAALARVMKDGAELRFATGPYGLCAVDPGPRDPPSRLRLAGAKARRLAPASLDGFETRYELKAAGQGLASVHLGFQRRHRTAK